MTFFRVFAFALVAVALVATISVPVTAAGAAGNVSTTETTPEAPADGAAIDDVTTLLNATYDDGMARVRLESEIPQTVTISGVTSLETGGSVPFRVISIDRGETVTVEVEADVIRGRTGVLIATQQERYQQVIEVSEPLIGGPWTAQDAQLAALAAALATSLVVAVVAIRRATGRDTEGRRVA